MAEYYDLDDQPCEMLVWANLFENRRLGDGRWRVGYDEAEGISVSTVWLGLNHAFGEGPPLIYETLVSGGQYSDEMERYSTRAEAEAGHAAWVLKAITERGC